MEQKPEEIRKKEFEFSREEFKQFLNWFYIAILAFISVVLLFQLVLAGVSVAFGYETHIFFGKVDSLPHLNKYWSSSRVLMMYALPSVILLLNSVFIIAVSYGSPDLSRVVWFRFWFMVFSILLATTQMTVSVFSGFTSKAISLEGFLILMRWFDWTTPAAICFVVLSVLINVAFGFLSSAAIVYIAPKSFYITHGKTRSGRIVVYAFIYPMLLLIPLVMLVVYPDYELLFGIMFLHALLWLPGLFNISRDSIMKRRSSDRKTFAPYSNYILGAITLLVLIIVRVFFV